MESKAVWKILLYFALLAIPTIALADIETNGILDDVYRAYADAALSWERSIKIHASELFWVLALISMTWTFGLLALRNADIAEFFAEFIRFTMFTGFFWWLLDNGPTIAVAIINSLRQIGADASRGSHPSVHVLPSPSGIVDVGFDIFQKVIDKSTIWSPFTSAVGVFISLIILVVFALLAVNMLLMIISAWILAYAGIFFLGFGGSRWTSDMAISYFRTVLGMAAKILTMILLVGVGKSFIDTFYARMSSDLRLTELVAVMVVAIVMAALVDKLPNLLAGLVSGGGSGALGSGYGAGHAAAAMAMGASAIATAGSAMVGSAANAWGAGRALAEAGKSAGATGSRSLTGEIAKPQSSNDEGKEGMPSSVHQAPSTMNSPSRLAERMGEIDSPHYAGSGGKAAQDIAGSADPPGSASVPLANNMASEDSPTESRQFSTVGNEMSSGSMAQFSDSGPSETSARSTGQFSDSGPSDIPTSNGGSYSDSGPDTNPSSGSEKIGAGNYSDAGYIPDEQSQNGENPGASSAMQRITKPARFAARFTGALAVGALDVAKGALSARADKTIGNKLAVAIRNRRTSLQEQADGRSESENTLSAGTHEPVDRASEIAAFENRDSETDAPVKKAQNNLQQPK